MGDGGAFSELGNARELTCGKREGFSLGQWEAEVLLGHPSEDNQQARVDGLFHNRTWAEWRQISGYSAFR